MNIDKITELLNQRKHKFEGLIDFHKGKSNDTHKDIVNNFTIKLNELEEIIEVINGHRQDS